jgi:hypothetical protein
MIWTKEELKLLSKAYTDPELSIEEIMELLPGRTEPAIRIKASRLGIRRPVIEVPQDIRIRRLIREFKSRSKISN